MTTLQPKSSRPTIASEIDTIEYSLEDILSEKVIAKAEALGCEVVCSNGHVLLLDLDSDEDRTFAMMQYSRLWLELDFVSFESYKSRNGNYHAIVRSTRKFTVTQRIMLQAIMGSDRTKEALSLIRVERKDPNPIILLRPKDAKVHMVYGMVKPAQTKQKEGES